MGNSPPKKKPPPVSILRIVVGVMGQERVCRDAGAAPPFGCNNETIDLFSYVAVVQYSAIPCSNTAWPKLCLVETTLHLTNAYLTLIFSEGDGTCTARGEVVRKSLAFLVSGELWGRICTPTGTCDTIP